MDSVKVFNAIFKALLVTVKKETTDASVKNDIKRAYRMFNPAGEGYRGAFRDRFTACVDAVGSSDGQTVGILTAPADAQLLNGVAVKRVTDSCKKAIKAVDALFRALLLAVKLERLAEDEVHASMLAHSYQRCLAAGKSDDLREVLVDDDLAQFADACLADLVETGMSAVVNKEPAANPAPSTARSASAPPAEGGGGFPAGMPDANSVMQMAMRMADQFDLSAVAGGGGGSIQKLVSTVATSVTEALSRGDIDQADLIRDAAGLLGSLNAPQ